MPDYTPGCLLCPECEESSGSPLSLSNVPYQGSGSRSLNTKTRALKYLKTLLGISRPGLQGLTGIAALAFWNVFMLYKNQFTARCLKMALNPACPQARNWSPLKPNPLNYYPESRTQTISPSTVLLPQTPSPKSLDPRTVSPKPLNPNLEP